MEPENEEIYHLRKLQVLPYSLNSVINHDCWKKSIKYASEEMSKLAYLGSTLFNFHLLRLLETGKINDLKEDFFDKHANVRSWYVGVSEGCKPTKDLFFEESKEKWNLLFKNNKNEKPLSYGLQSVINGQASQYFTMFQNYHNYGIIQHYSYYLSKKYNISQRKAKEISESILGSDKDKEKKKKKEKSKEKDMCAEDDNYTITFSDEENKVINVEKEYLSSYKISNLTDRIKFHYFIQKELEKIEETKLFTMAPICSLKRRFVGFNKSCLKDLYNLNKSIISKSKNNQKHHTHLRIPISIDDAKLVTVTEIPENNKDILNDRGLKRTIMRKRGYDYSLEFRTDGVQVKFSWEKIVEKKSTNKKKKDKNKKTEKEKKKIRAPGVMKPVYSYTKSDSFENETKGIFNKESLMTSNIKEGTLIIANDPGHKNPLTTVKAVYQKDITKMKFKESYSISLGEYYYKIGNKKMLSKINNKKSNDSSIKEIEKLWSLNSLKKTTSREYLDSLINQLKDWNYISHFYRSSNLSREMFNNQIKKQKLLEEIKKLTVPSKNSLFINGSAKFATSRPGLSATPVAKIVENIARDRRVVITPEQFTTCRCSDCLVNEENDNCNNIKMKNLKGNKTYVNKEGVTKNVSIHGLKHCTQCSRLWKRDVNAAINIGKAFLYLNKYQRRPFSLTKMSACNHSKVQNEISRCR